MKIKATFQLEKEQFTWLQEYAYKEKVSQSSIVRNALKEYQEATGYSKKGFGTEQIPPAPKKKEWNPLDPEPPIITKKVLKEAVQKKDDHPGFCEHGAMIGNCKFGCKKKEKPAPLKVPKGFKMPDTWTKKYGKK